MTAAWWPYSLGAVLLMALMIVGLLVQLLRKASRASQFRDAAEPEPPDEKAPDANADATAAERTRKADGRATVGIAAAFRRAAKLLDEAGHRQYDDVPLFLLVGAEGSREPELLATARVDLPFGTPDTAGMSLGEGRGFWVFDAGTILDVAGEMVLRADGTSDERGWSSVLEHLRRFRPKRPLDGALVTLAASELLDASHSEQGRAELRTRMNHIHRKLVQVQLELGFRVPCYITVTGCQELTGFRSFCTSVPSESREQMLGWSSPYSIDTAYRPSWNDEAMAACTGRLEELQLEAFTDGTPDPGSLFRFPDALRSLTVPLGICLDQLLKPSAYHGALIMRGLYFCGREDDYGRAHPFAPPARGETAFLRELIEKKMFAEHGLARPTAGLIMQRQRAVRHAQLTAATLFLIFGFGLLNASHRLAHQNTVMIPFLQQRKEVQAATAQLPGNAPAKPTDLDAPAGLLLDAMGKIDFRYYGSYFIPSSWFSPLRRTVNHSIESAFQDVIFRALRADLEKEAEWLPQAGEIGYIEELTPRPPPNPAPGAITDTFVPRVAEPSPRVLGMDTATPSVAAMPEFHELSRYVKKVAELEKAVKTFDRIAAPSAGELTDLGTLVKHCFDKDLPREFYDRSWLYADALTRVTAAKLDLSPYHDGAASRALGLARAFYGALYGDNAFAKQLQQLAGGLNQASTQWPKPLDADAFVDLARQEREIETQLARPELEWAFRKELDLGPEFHSLLMRIERSELLGRPVAEQIRREGSDGLFQFQRGLAEVKTPSTGPLLAIDRDGRPLMRLSPDALLVKAAVESFTAQGFVASVRPADQARYIPANVPLGERLVWDARLLEQSTAASQAYDRFRSKSLDIFPVDLRGSVENVARESTQARMTTLTAEAQSYIPIAPAVSPTTVEDQLRWDIANFTATEKPVLDNLDAFARQGAWQQRRAIAGVTSAEAARLLRAVDWLLEADGPYRPRPAGFSWWNGDSPVSPAAWGGREPADVNAYVEVTRARVTVLARKYAQPLLEWFTKVGTLDVPPDTQSLFTKWQGILDDLRDFDAKKPGNPVSALEDYIVADMPKVAPSNCKAAVAPALRSRTFFTLALNDLSRQLSTRCNAIAGKTANERYEELAKNFNERLAGHYPFGYAPPISNEREADPEDIRGFFRLFDADQALMKSTPEDAAPRGPNARQFIEQMAKVRLFFAPFLSDEKAVPEVSYDVEAAFRIFREQAGDEIIDWSVSVGDQTLTNRDKGKKPIRWTVGDPFRLSLRWADDGPRVPVLQEPERFAVITKRTLVYDYTNRWSLLTAIAAHRAGLELLPRYADLEPVTLAVPIRTVPAPTTNKKGSQPGDARAVESSHVFLRVTPLAPGTNQPLDPPRFPMRAPRSEAPAAMKGAE